MGKVIRNYLLGDLVFLVSLSTSIVLMCIGFILPPMGEISPSVLQGVAWMFGFATIAKGFDTIRIAIREGATARVRHGETELEISKEKDN